MKDIFIKVERQLNIFTGEIEDIKLAKIDLLQVKIMSAMNIRLYASEEMISELEDMKQKLSKMKQTKKNSGKEMSRAAVSSKTMSDNVIYM